MSTLVLAHDPPLPAMGGGALRVLHQSRQLARHLDDPVTVLALGDAPPAPDEPFALEGVPHAPSRLRVLASALRAPYLEVWSSSSALEQRMAEQRWDLVVATSPFVVRQALATAAPVVLDAANVESEVARTLAASDGSTLARARWSWEARKIERLERSIVPSLAAVTAPSTHDADAYRRLGASQVDVSPNGVDLAGWSWRPPTGRPRIGYVGQYGYRPNEAAAIELVDQVLPLVAADRPDVHVSLVGRAPTAAMLRRQGPAVQVTGAVEDLHAHVSGLGVLVVPLRAGGGTRLKLLEAMAAGVPVVSTPLGAAGLDVVDGTHLLLADRPEELAEATSRLLDDEGLARSISEAGRALVEDRYDWSVTARPLVERCRRLLRDGASG